MVSKTLARPAHKLVKSAHSSDSRPPVTDSGATDPRGPGTATPESPTAPGDRPASHPTAESAEVARMMRANDPKLQQMRDRAESDLESKSSIGSAIGSVVASGLSKVEDVARQHYETEVADARTRLDRIPHGEPEALNEAQTNLRVAESNLYVFDQRIEDREAAEAASIERDTLDNNLTDALERQEHATTSRPPSINAVERAAEDVDGARRALQAHDVGELQRKKDQYDIIAGQIDGYERRTEDVPSSLTTRFDRLENDLDPFRSGLPPEDRADYDAWLDTVENDPGIVIELDPDIDLAADGQTVAFNQNLAHRAIAAATFGNEAWHTDRFDADNPLTIYFNNEAPTVNVDGKDVAVGALASVDDRRIEIQFGEAGRRTLRGLGRNVFAHEYVHQLQDGQIVPPDAPNAEREGQRLTEIFNAARDGEDDGLQDLLRQDYPGFEDRWYKDDGSINAEPYAVAAGYFYERPDVLRDASPQLYDLMVRITGQDPAGT